MVKENIGCYTVKDLQEILHVSRPVIYNLLQKKEFRVLKIGEKYLIPMKSFEDWLYGKDTVNEY